MTETTRRIVHQDRDKYWVLTGPLGAITWELLTGNQPGPIAIHSATPQHDGHAQRPCEYVDGGCYCDTTDLCGSQLGAEWEASGRHEQVIWRELASWYDRRLLRKSHVPIDLDNAIRGHGPASLIGNECRQVLADVAAGGTIHEAIRARYSFRRQIVRGHAVGCRPSDVVAVLASYCKHLTQLELDAAFSALRAAVIGRDEPAVEAALDTLTGVRA